MAITLEKLCESTANKYNLKLIAGREGLKNAIRWVHMVEDIEVPNFLHGNELIFTTGIGRLDTAEKILEFVKGLQAHNAVGLVMNLGPYIKKVPNVVIDYCEKNGFPLFTLPWEVKIIDITYDFCRIIIENEKSEVSAVEAFRHIMIRGEYKEEYDETFKKMGFQTKSRYRVILVDILHRGRSITENFVNNNYIQLWKLLTKPTAASAMFVMDGKLAVIRQNASDSQLKKAAEALDKGLEAGGITFVMGISGEENGAQSVHELYKEAEAAFYTACADGKQTVFYKNIGINRLIFGVENKRVLESFVADRLEPLMKYDAENKTDYTQILRLYLESCGSIKTVADRTNMHRNTINYKIKQIREILGCELNVEDKTELLAAYRITDLLKYL